MELNLLEVIVFENPHRIDWDATDEEIRQKIIDLSPDEMPSALAMLASAICLDVRKRVKKYGVYKLYLLIQGEKEKIDIGAKLRRIS